MRLEEMTRGTSEHAENVVVESAAEASGGTDELELQACVLQLKRLTGMPYEVVAAGLREAVDISPYDFRTVTDQLVRGIIRMGPRWAPRKRNPSEPRGLLSRSIVIVPK